MMAARDELRLPHVLVVVAGGEGAAQVAQLLVGALHASGRASRTVEVARFDEALEGTQLAMVMVVAECDAEGLSMPTRRWLRKGRAELLAARRCDVITVAQSACCNSAAGLKPCAVAAAAKLGARLRAGGAAVNERAVYVDVGVAVDVEETLRTYVRRLALGGRPEAVGSQGALAIGEGGPRARLSAAHVLGLGVSLPALALALAAAAVVTRRLLARRSC